MAAWLMKTTSEDGEIWVPTCAEWELRSGETNRIIVIVDCSCGHWVEVALNRSMTQCACGRQYRGFAMVMEKLPT